MPPTYSQLLGPFIGNVSAFAATIWFIKLPFPIPIPSSIQYLSPSTENEPKKLEKQAVVAAESAKAPANDVERIEL